MEEENEENLRFKFASGIDRQTRNLAIFQNVNVVELNQVEMMCYLTVPCFIPVSFPLRFYNFLTRTGYFPPCEKVQDFGAPKFIFKPRALAFLVSHKRKDSGDENTSSFGTRTSF